MLSVSALAAVTLRLPRTARRLPALPRCDLPATSKRCYAMLSDQGKSGSDFKVGAQVRERFTTWALSTKNSGSSTILLPPDPKVVLGGSDEGFAPREPPEASYAPTTATAGTPPVLPDVRSSLF